MRQRLAPAFAASLLGLLAACGGGDDDAAPISTGPKLTALDVQVGSFNGEKLEPAFDPAVTQYTLRVQSDIYGVLVQPRAASGVAVSAEAAITAGAYSTTVSNTDEAKPEAIPYTNTWGPYGYLVKLSQSYAAFDVEYKQTATFTLTSPSGETSRYTVDVIRDNDSAIRAKFGAEKVFTATSGFALKYHIYFPPNYLGGTRRYPVVLALHGAGQRGVAGQPSDMTLKRYKQATSWAQDSEANSLRHAIVISPQAQTAWVSNDPSGTLSPDGQAAYELLLDVMAKERVNLNRVYLTGLSLGGNGGLVMATRYPQTFAGVLLGATWAGSPNSSTNTGAGYNWAGLKQHLDGKIFLFHNVDDQVVNFTSYQNVSNRLAAADVAFTSKIYPSGTFSYPDSHFSWTPAYADKDIRDWLFGQTR